MNYNSYLHWVGLLHRKKLHPGSSTQWGLWCRYQGAPDDKYLPFYVYVRKWGPTGCPQNLRRQVHCHYNCVDKLACFLLEHCHFSRWTIGVLVIEQDFVANDIYLILWLRGLLLHLTILCSCCNTAVKLLMWFSLFFTLFQSPCCI